MKKKVHSVQEIFEELFVRYPALKSFLFYRKLDEEFETAIEENYGSEGRALAQKMEGALPSIPLPSIPR